MNHSALRIVYMGTPDFAVAPLDKILRSGGNVVAVITAPDRPAGRGKRIRFSAVKEYLLRNRPEIPMLQPSNLKDPGFVEELRSIAPDLQIVVAFRMLPEMVWRIPKKGTFNLHASLLPQYRGAAPINHVLINGEKETGVSTFLIDDKIDTGNILLQQSISIGNQESAGELHDRLMDAGAGLVLQTVEGLAAGDLQARPQDSLHGNSSDLKKAPKIFKEDCRINWNKEGMQVFNLIRGLSPYPGAFTYLHRDQGQAILCKIFKSTFRPGEQAHTPGTIQSDGKTFLEVSVQGGWIQVLSIQQEGKRKLEIRDFLAGTSLTTGPCRFS
ncbi:MAG: methionyl-tRNA formyltransferase [Bacteroidota bacterium]